MIKLSEDMQDVFMSNGVTHRDIICAALCIMELEQGGKGRGFCEEMVQSQRRAGTDHLDFAVDLLKYLPDCSKQKRKIEEYARGIGAEVYTIRKFIYSVPDEIWRIGARIARNL